MTADNQNQAWKRFATWAVFSSVALVLTLVGAMYLIDPYDTGRSPFSREPDLRGQRELNATASVGRNPRYQAMVIGNSTISQISPSRLTELTGMPFGQLAVPGAQIPEQMAVLEWFMKHHDGTAKALVMALSRDVWCDSDPTQPGNNSFPFWRIGDSTAEYLAGLISMSSAKQAGRRLGILPASRAKSGPDGYWDYEPLYATLFTDEPRRRELLFKRMNDRHALGEPSFPGVRVLGERLAALPADLPIVLVVPPVFTARQPQAGTPRHRAEQACRQRLIELAAGRPNTALVDWWDDRPELKKTDAFIDQIHYRHPIARTMEQDIAAALLDIRKRAGSLTLR
ncbi:hypothetical protein AB4097_02080 [Microvirga sp. 2MCAF35]|uniref:hypothetical protein n=1 Tax=Microvirga sp. 2MCAF35 TaxID=3232987 RepID=UPI003F992BAF